jgi:serine/threonine protein kinase
MLSPGSSIGRYVVKKRLAEGGMAEVYLAEAIGPEGFAKDVVIKVVRSFLASDQQFIDMFIAEARLSSRLNHANVVQIFDFGKHDDSYFIAMEYVRGASLFDLRKRCRERGVPFPPTLVAEIGAQVARGLQYAHGLSDKGKPLAIVHRDVTPHNVLLSFDGAVKLTDFGIAKASTSHTAPGILKGKFAYMSPEQARGELVDARTDLFALGIVLWEMLTGGRLFDGDSEMAVLRAVQESLIAPPDRLNPDIPHELSEIVLKALASSRPSNWTRRWRPSCCARRARWKTPPSRSSCSRCTPTPSPPRTASAWALRWERRPYSEAWCRRRVRSGLATRWRSIAPTSSPRDGRRARRRPRGPVSPRGLVVPSRFGRIRCRPLARRAPTRWRPWARGAPTRCLRFRSRTPVSADRVHPFAPT